MLGDESLFDEILIMFQEDHGEDHHKIQRAIDESDQKQIKHLVHTIKGVSCSIGAMNLFEYCKALDMAVSNDDNDQYVKLFTPLKDELIKVISGIEKRLISKHKGLHFLLIFT